MFPVYLITYQQRRQHHFEFLFQSQTGTMSLSRRFPLSQTHSRPDMTTSNKMNLVLLMSSINKSSSSRQQTDVTAVAKTISPIPFETCWRAIPRDKLEPI